MFLGVGIYLIVDNAILPFRTDRALREGFVQCTGEARAVLAEARQAIVALVATGPTTAPTTVPTTTARTAPVSATAGTSTRNPVTATLPAPPTHHLLQFDQCAVHLDACDAAVTRLALLVARQGVGLKSVVHEPVILSPPFPVSEYAALLGQFVKVGMRLWLGLCLCLCLCCLFLVSVTATVTVTMTMTLWRYKDSRHAGWRIDDVHCDEERCLVMTICDACIPVVICST